MDLTLAILSHDEHPALAVFIVEPFVSQYSQDLALITVRPGVLFWEYLQRGNGL